MRIRSYGLVVVAVVGLVGSSGTDASEPMVTDFLNLVPNLQSADGSIRSLEVVGTMKLADAGEVRVRALYRAPDRYSILISDAGDGTPLVYAADRQLLFYDPIRSSLSYLKDCSQRLTLETNGQAARFAFGFGREGKKVPDVDFFQLDVKSFCTARRVDEQRVVDDGGGRYRLFLNATGGSTVVCSFDTSRPRPFQGLKVFDRSGNDPVLSLDKVEVDGSLKDEDFRFPDRKQLAKKIKVHELAGGFLEEGAQMVMISKAIRTRFEANHPGLRATIQPPGYENQTWKAIEKHDLKSSAVVRELLPVDRYAVARPKPKKPAATPGVPVAGAAGPTTR